MYTRDMDGPRGSAIDFEMDEAKARATAFNEKMEIRKRWCCRLSDSIMKNFKISGGEKNFHLATENIQYIARKKEFNAYKACKTVHAYQFRMTEMAYDLQNFALREDLIGILSKNHADFLKDIDKWGPYFHVSSDNVDEPQSCSNQCSGTSNEKEKTDVNRVEKFNGNKRRLRVIKNIRVDPPIGIRKVLYPTLSLFLEKENIDHNLARALDEIQPTLCTRNDVCQKEAILSPPPEKRPRRHSNNDEFLKDIGADINQLDENMDPHFWTKKTMKVVRSLVDKYYKTPYIPSKDKYKFVFRKVYVEILKAKIHDVKLIEQHAEKAITSKKYLETGNAPMISKIFNFFKNLISFE